LPFSMLPISRSSRWSMSERRFGLSMLTSWPSVLIPPLVCRQSQTIEDVLQVVNAPTVPEDQRERDGLWIAFGWQVPEFCSKQPLEAVVNMQFVQKHL
jgi:hypothetical protein